MHKKNIQIDSETLQDLISLETGLYSPLTGFMDENDYRSVVDKMCLSSDSVWTLPITLAAQQEEWEELSIGDTVCLQHEGAAVASINITSLYTTNGEIDCQKVFKTIELEHPGVFKEMSRSKYRVGGKTEILQKNVLAGSLNPASIRAIFKEKGWKTIVGFQTRNPLHRAHEFIQRIGLKECDGLFVNPSVGWKKAGDFSEEAVFAGYEAMIDNYYSHEIVHLEGLRVAFRYAGPREAVFHALLRKNLGCTHFIVGRDHAGVGNYYGSFEAHELLREIMKDHDLGIKIIFVGEPCYCKKCNDYVFPENCKHDSSEMLRVSGTLIREMLKRGELPDGKFMRPEIAKAILEVGDNMFVRSSL